MERVRTLVERYRQSVLKAAVTGELTREWREQHAGQLESGEALLTRILEARRNFKAKLNTEPLTCKTDELPEIPESWTWASLDQLCQSFGNGLSGKPAHEKPGLPILRISAVRAMSVNSQDLRYYRPREKETVEAFYVQRGDLLFTRYNGSRELVGASGIYNGSEPVLHPDKLIRARLIESDRIIPGYLEIALNSGATWRFIESKIKTSAGQHGVAGSDLKRAPIPLPSVREQIQIVEHFAKARDAWEHLAEIYGDEHGRSSALKQAALKAAFSGQLVPQDPNDEPASVLLERIAAERAAAAPKPRAAKAGKGRRGSPAGMTTKGMTANGVATNGLITPGLTTKRRTARNKKAKA